MHNDDDVIRRGGETTEGKIYLELRHASQLLVQALYAKVRRRSMRVAQRGLRSTFGLRFFVYADMPSGFILTVLRHSKGTGGDSESCMVYGSYTVALDGENVANSPYVVYQE